MRKSSWINVMHGKSMIAGFPIMLFISWVMVRIDIINKTAKVAINKI